MPNPDGTRASRPFRPACSAARRYCAPRFPSATHATLRGAPCRSISADRARPSIALVNALLLTTCMLSRPTNRATRNRIAHALTPARSPRPPPPTQRRFVITWLTFLPFCSWRVLGWATVPVDLLLGFFLLGIEEIGVQVEEPLSILALEVTLGVWGGRGVMFACIEGGRGYYVQQPTHAQPTKAPIIPHQRPCNQTALVWRGG